MKYIITEQQHNVVIDKFITFQLEPHEERFSKHYPDSTFWIKDGKLIAEVNKKYNHFYLGSEIWSTISIMFSLEDDETKKVVRKWLKEHYKLRGLTPKDIYRHGSWVLEEN